MRLRFLPALMFAGVKVAQWHMPSPCDESLCLCSNQQPSGGCAYRNGDML